MAAPIGAVVRLYYDHGEALPPEPGDCLRSNGGSLYLVLAARLGRRPGRSNLQCLKVATPPAGALIVPLFWYRRERARR